MMPYYFINSNGVFDYFLLFFTIFYNFA